MEPARVVRETEPDRMCFCLKFNYYFFSRAPFH